MKYEIVVFEHDIQKYPPILSIIYYLLEKKKKVCVISCCYDLKLIDDITSKGGVFYNIIDNDIHSNQLTKLVRLFKFKKKTNKIISNFDHEKINKIFLFGETAVWLLGHLSFSYKCVAYLFEIPNLVVSTRYKLLSPKLDYQKVLQAADKVVCCEYNRAHITKSYFNLDVLPLVIPNKPLELDLTELGIEVPPQLYDKKVILYQGIFNYPERKMDDLCDAVEDLDEEFVVCLMGSDNEYKNFLKAKYALSDRIIFLPYIPAPQHLNITKLAYIGFLSYYAESGNIKNSLNTLYCAPNKIFEYSKFSVPMLSNDVPALSLLFNRFDAGVATDLSKENIIKAVKKIDSRYEEYSIESKRFYDSVDLKKLYLEILK